MLSILARGRPRLPLLEVTDLRTHFFTREGVVHAVDGVSFSVEKGCSLPIRVSGTMRNVLSVGKAKPARCATTAAALAIVSGVRRPSASQYASRRSALSRPLTM